MKKSNGRHLWTKDEIKQVINLWESKTCGEIADELGVKAFAVMAMARKIRLAGYPLPKKWKGGYLNTLVKEVVAEIK